MGQASKRKRVSVEIRRSALTNKWAVDVDFAGRSIRLDVFYDKKDAENDARLARQVFREYTASQLKSDSVLQDALSRYVSLSMAIGPESDDEFLAVYKVE